MESAIALPKHLYYYEQGDLYDMAAAYAYHIAENQTFFDGNKRTAITTALVFLELNGVSTSPLSNLELYDAIIAIAESGSIKRDLPPSSAA